MFEILKTTKNVRKIFLNETYNLVKKETITILPNQNTIIAYYVDQKNPEIFYNLTVSLNNAEELIFKTEPFGDVALGKEFKTLDSAMKQMLLEVDDLKK